MRFEVRMDARSESESVCQIQANVPSIHMATWEEIKDHSRPYVHCLATEDCLFTLLISLNEILRLMLPTPDLDTVASSATILCVLGLGFDRFGTTAPALNVRSERNESLSEANFRRAFSKSTSFRVLVPFT